LFKLSRDNRRGIRKGGRREGGGREVGGKRAVGARRVGGERGLEEGEGAGRGRRVMEEAGRMT